MNKHQRARGAVVVIVAFMMVAIIGFLGLAIDFGYAYVQRNRLQNVADAEALACAISPAATPCPAGTYGDQYPATNTYGFTVSIFNPGDNSLCLLPSQSQCVRATTTSSWPTYFIPLFGINTLTGSAVAIAGRIGGEQGCLIAPNYFSVSGSQGIQGSNCANYFGSVSSNGNPPVVGTANYIYNGNAPSSCPTCQPPAISKSGALVPPALNASSPNYPTLPGAASATSGFTGTPQTTLTCPKKTTCTLAPGLYNNIDCSNSQAVCQLNPTGSTPAGYTFAFNGDFVGPGNNGSLTGNHVLMYMNGTGKTLTLSGGGTLTLSSPSLAGGACSGSISPESQLVIYSPNSGLVTYNGNVASAVTGNIYMPKYTFALGGNGGLNINGTAVVDAYQDAGGGNSGLTVNGANACGFTPTGSGRAVLVD